MHVLIAQARGYEGASCVIRDIYNYEIDLREASRAYDAQFFPYNNNL